VAPFALWECATYLPAGAAHARSQVAVALGGKVSSQVLDEMIVRLGSPAVVLKQAVAQVDAEFVVLGGKHHSTLGRWLGGSTSLNVARTTEVPVLVTAAPPTVLRRVLAAVDTILREATDWKADLLVVGSHGKGWAARVLVGSVTERLLNHLPTSLIVVPVSAAQVAEPAEVTLATAMA